MRVVRNGNVLGDSRLLRRDVRLLEEDDTGEIASPVRSFLRLGRVERHELRRIASKRALEGSEVLIRVTSACVLYPFGLALVQRRLSNCGVGRDEFAFPINAGRSGVLTLWRTRERVVGGYPISRAVYRVFGVRGARGGGFSLVVIVWYRNPGMFRP